MWSCGHRLQLKASGVSFVAARYRTYMLPLAEEITRVQRFERSGGTNDNDVRLLR
jgi:hypothetical protein